MNTATKNVFLTFAMASIVIIITFLAYSSGMQGPFVFDDIPNIVNREALWQSGDLVEILSFRPTRAIGYGSFAINYAAHGLWATGFRLVNVLIHIGTTLALFGLLLQCFGRSTSPGEKPISIIPRYRDYTIAASVALAFCLHPIQTQAVTYVVQRFTCLAGFLFICSVWSYLKCINGGPYSRVFLGATFFTGAAAMLTKENTVTLPFVIFSIEYFFGSGQLTKRFQRLALANAGILLPIALLLTKTQQTLDASVVRPAPHFFDYWLTQIHLLPKYFLLLVYPVSQSLDHNVQLISSITDTRLLGGLLILSALVVLSLWARKKSPLVALGIAIFFAGWIVEAVVPLPDLFWEHRMYLPSLGIFVSLAAVLNEIVSSQFKLSALTLALLVIAAFGIGTYNRNKVWQSQTSIWTDAIAKGANSSRAFTNLSVALASEHLAYQQSETMVLKALEIDAEDINLWINLSRSQSHDERFQEAVNSAQRAVAIDPSNFSAAWRLATALSENGQSQAAVEVLTKHLDAPQAVARLANITLNAKTNTSLSDAKKWLEKLPYSDNYSADIWLVISRVAMAEGNFDVALSAAKKAVSEPSALGVEAGLWLASISAFQAQSSPPEAGVNFMETAIDALRKALQAPFASTQTYRSGARWFLENGMSLPAHMILIRALDGCNSEKPPCRRAVAIDSEIAAIERDHNDFAEQAILWRVTKQ